jgi:hypothetical protein
MVKESFLYYKVAATAALLRPEVEDMLYISCWLLSEEESRRTVSLNFRRSCSNVTCVLLSVMYPASY